MGGKLTCQLECTGENCSPVSAQSALAQIGDGHYCPFLMESFLLFWGAPASIALPTLPHPLVATAAGFHRLRRLLVMDSFPD